MAFGASIYFFEFIKADKDQVEKEKSEKVLSFDPGKVKKLNFKNSFGEFELEKDNLNNWQITKPIKALGDETIINSLLSSLSNEKYEQVVAPKGADLKPYGLDNPKLSLKITFTDGSLKTLSIGSDGALQGKLYAMTEGPVLYANQAMKYQVDKALKELRDKRVVRKNREELGKVTVKSKAGAYSLLKKDKKWFLEKPVMEKADEEAIIAFFNTLESLRATDFAEKMSSDHPEIEISLYDNNQKLYDVLIIGPKKQNSSYIKSQTTQTIYQVFANSVDGFVKKADDFKDKKTVLQFARDNLNSFSIKIGLVNYSFIKKESGWELTKPDPSKEVNQVQVMQLLNQLSTLKASEFFDKKAEIKKPEGEVVLRDAKGELLLDLRWGDKTPTGKSLYSMTQKSEKLFGIQDSLIKSLPSQTLLQDKKSEVKK